MNIYVHEFKKSFGSVITWSVSIVALMLAFLSMYNAFAADAQTLNELMSRYPKELLMAFGMTDMDMSTPLGFYGLIFTFVQICLAIQAANYGFGLVSIEETEMTADFLLTRPVNRTQILTAKLLAVFTSLTITNAVVWIFTLAFFPLFLGGRSYDANTLTVLLSSIVVFQLTFLTLGLFFSLMTKRMRSVIPYSMGLAFGTYVLSAFGGLLGDVKLELITPFNHFAPNDIVNSGAIDLSLAAISVVYIVVAVVGSYVLYLRRNIHTAV